MLSKRLRVAGTCVILGMAVARPVVGAEPIRQTPLTIRTYNLFGVPRRDVRSAQRTAQAIFHKAGITSVEWLECHERPPAVAADDCAEVLRPNEVLVRILRAPARWSNPWALGFSYAGTTASWLSTVFADHVAATAGRFHLDANGLLGRAIAHEIGHLLLGTASHSETGLMRANWDQSSLTRLVPADWVFSRAEAAQLLAEMHTRSLTTASLAARTPAEPSPAIASEQ